MITASMKWHLFTKLLKIKKIPQYITGLTLLAFVVLIFVGMFDCTNLFMQSQMDMKGSGHTMKDCPPGKNCGMDLNQHLGIWQSMFTTTMGIDFLSLFSALFVLLSAAVALFKFFSCTDDASLVSRYLYYERDHRENKLYNYLVTIFSSGIVQPKIFA